MFSRFFIGKINESIHAEDVSGVIISSEESNLLIFRGKSVECIPQKFLACVRTSNYYFVNILCVNQFDDFPSEQPDKNLPKR